MDVLHDVNFEIAAGEMVVIQGNSGSGKTTLLLDCGAMQNPTSGRVEINQKDIFNLSPSARNAFRSSQIGYLFQTLELVPYLSLLDNVRMVKSVTTESAKRWLDRLGLSDRQSHKPDSLSHGQRQRGALARAVAHQPDLLIVDEPTGNLDPVNARIVFETLREIADQGAAVLVASHDPGIYSIADRHYQIESGTLTSGTESSQ